MYLRLPVSSLDENALIDSLVYHADLNRFASKRRLHCLGHRLARSNQVALSWCGFHKTHDSREVIPFQLLCYGSGSVLAKRPGSIF